METRDLRDFTQSAGDERTIIFKSQACPSPPPLLNAAHLEQDVLEEHSRGHQPPDVCAYALEECTCWGTGLLVRRGKPIFFDDVLPDYFNQPLANFPDVWTGALKNPEPRQRTYNGPIAVALHPNIVYGHFLLEMLPRLYVLGLLQSLGLDFPLLLPDRIAPWVHHFVDLYYDSDRIVLQDWQSDMFIAPKFIVPSMMHSHFAYHPALNLMVDDVLRRSGITPWHNTAQQGRRVYISRSLHAGGWHLMENEEEIEGLMSGFGFEIVHPQNLPLQEQLAIYASSSIIVGQFSSALHNAIFAPPGATVIALNRINWYQSSIARIRRQRLAYILPADGIFRDHTTSRSGEQVRFHIDTRELAALIYTII